MRFRLEYRPAVQAFLAGLTLSRAGRLRLFNALLALARVSDGVRLDPANRLGPFFVFRRTIRENGRLLTIRLIVDDSPAVFGVLRAVYADVA